MSPVYKERSSKWHKKISTTLDTKTDEYCIFTQSKHCGYMDMQEAHFTVSLCDYPELPEDKRQQAEARYARVLTRQLGGEEQVGQALSLVQGLEDTPPADITEEAKLTFQRWMKAARAAAEAGLQGIGGTESCFFDVRRIYH